MPKDIDNLCPILLLAKLSKSGGEQGYSTRCREDRCRWWDEVNEQCCVKTIATKA